MSVSNWNREPDWDELYLGGERVPGVAQVHINLPSGLDVQKPKGKKKARIKDLGTPPAELSISIELLPEEVEAFAELAKRVIRPPSSTGARDPLDIGHPNAALWDIYAITCGDVQAPMPSSGGTYIVTINAVEWVPAPKTVKKSKEQPVGAERTLQSMIDENRPSQIGIVGDNFSSPDQLLSLDPEAF